MQRKISNPQGGQVRGVTSSKTYERQFQEVMERMVANMSRQWKNQVLLSLNKSTIEKFEDRQVGNYASVLLGLNRKAQRKLLKRFSNKSIERFVKKLLGKVNRRNAQQFYNTAEEAIGISSKELMATEGLSFQINALELETAQWAKKLRDETLEMYTANSLRVMAQGGSLVDVLANFEDMEEKRKNHAKMVARTQVSTFNSLVEKARAQTLGLEEAEWETSGDERVRPCHAVRNGKKFKLSEGLYSSCDKKFLLPGVDYQCRCTYRYVIPKED